MRVLLIGDGGSIWMAKYVEKVLVPLGHHVTVLSAREIPSVFESSYRAPQVEVEVQKGPAPLLAKVPYLRRLSKRARTAAAVGSSGRFDVVHVQMALLDPVRLAVRIGGSRLVISYWGSDLLRRSPAKLRAMRRFLRRADLVTVNSEGMRKTFEQTYAGLCPSPLVIPFGINGLDAIDALRASDPPPQQHNFGIPAGKVVVTAGYNGRREQQHLLMLDAICGLPRESQEQIHVILPMSYGAKEDHVREVQRRLISVGCSSTVLTTFLDEVEQASLALATDVFINAQTTDALSATLQEFIYAGAVILNGSWLKYPELTEAGVVMHEFSDTKELTDLLETRIKNDGMSDRDNRANTQAMRSRSWGAVLHRWAELYKREDQPE